MNRQYPFYHIHKHLLSSSFELSCLSSNCREIRVSIIREMICTISFQECINAQANSFLTAPGGLAILYYHHFPSNIYTSPRPWNGPVQHRTLFDLERDSTFRE